MASGAEKLSKLARAIAAATSLIVMGCANADQRAANEKVRAANVAIEQADVLRAEDRKAIMALGIVTRDKMIEEGRLCLTRREGAFARLDNAASLLQQASSMRVAPTYREYLALKAEEVSKRARAVAMTIDQCHAMVAGNEPEPWADGHRDKALDALIKEIAELEKKSRKIRDENPQAFVDAW